MNRKTALFAFVLAASLVWGCGNDAKPPAYDISGRWQPDGGMTCEGNTDSLILDSLEAGFDPDRLEYVIEQDGRHVTFTLYRDGVQIDEETGLIIGDTITHSYSTAASYGTTTGTIEAADRIYLEDSWTNTADDSQVVCSFYLVPIEG